MEGKELCEICRVKLSWIGKNRCLRCGQKKDRISMECSFCENKNFPFHRTEALFSYEGMGRDLILQMKFGKCKGTSIFLGRLLGKKLSHFPPYQKAGAIIPIPLSFLREWRRGFNQAQILAQGISHILSIPVLEPLKRKRHTVPQSLLSPEERAENLKEAFALAFAPTLPKEIILVDDVFTTGTTLRESAQILRLAGVKKIRVAVVAR